MYFAFFGFSWQNGCKYLTLSFSLPISACFPKILIKIWGKPMHIDYLISETSCKENTNYWIGCDAFPNSVLHSERHVTCPSGKRNNGFSQIAPNSRTHQKHPNFASFGCLQPCTITNYVSDTIAGINGMKTAIYMYRVGKLDNLWCIMAPFQYAWIWYDP